MFKKPSPIVGQLYNNKVACDTNTQEGQEMINILNEATQKILDLYATTPKTSTNRYYSEVRCICQEDEISEPFWFDVGRKQ